PDPDREDPPLPAGRDGNRVLGAHAVDLRPAGALAGHDLGRRSRGLLHRLRPGSGRARPAPRPHQAPAVEGQSGTLVAFSLGLPRSWRGYSLARVRVREPFEEVVVAASPSTPASRSVPREPLSEEELRALDAWWRACNYLAAGMIYLRDNPLLREPLELRHVKKRLLGHWGSSPGLSFVYAHMNRLIRKYDLD